MKSELVGRITCKERLQEIFDMTYKIEIEVMKSSKEDAKRISEKVVKAIVKIDLVEEIAID